MTLSCQERGIDQLCEPKVVEALLAAAKFYYEQRKWCPSLFLLMPDHVHMLVRFGRGNNMTAVVRGWKRYTAARHGIVWQRDFFEHRLRAGESLREKAEYILQNPVRAGLVDDASAWPFALRFG